MILPAIPHVIRRGARYSYRRRLPVPFCNSRPITLSLGTSEPRRARQTGALLSVRWEGLVMSVRYRDELTATEVRALFQESLSAELARAVEEFQFGAGTDHEKTIANRVIAWTVEQALKSLADSSTLDRDQEVTVHGEADSDQAAELIEGYREMIDQGAVVLKEVQDSNLSALHRLPAPVSENILRQAPIGCAVAYWLGSARTFSMTPWFNARMIILASYWMKRLSARFEDFRLEGLPVLLVHFQRPAHTIPQSILNRTRDASAR